MTGSKSAPDLGSIKNSNAASSEWVISNKKTAFFGIFDSYDRKAYVIEFIFSKAAQAAILTMYSTMDANLLPWGINK